MVDKNVDKKGTRAVVSFAILAFSAVTLLTLTASFNYVLNYMLADLDATDSQSDMIRQIPSIAALLVIFVAGAIGDRLGARLDAYGVRYRVQ